MGPAPQPDPADLTQVVPTRGPQHAPPVEATRAMPSQPQALRPPAPHRPPGSPPAPGVPTYPAPARPRPQRRSRRRALRWIAAILIVALVLVGARVAWLWHKVDEGLGRVDALSGAADTPGETWLIVGSDSRSDGAVRDGTEGARADSIMVLHKADNGKAALVTLPRDTFVQIPGNGGNKINAAYAFGGPALLVRTAEELTGLTMDHYVEVGMAGVERMVDAVDGVELCLDYDVSDPESGLVWDTSQGTCQRADGKQALAYSRMRKSDPTGDIGRGLRQRAVISAVVSEAVSLRTLMSLSRQDAIAQAGASTLTVDEDSGPGDVGAMVLAFRSASGSALTGAPPIESLAYEPGGIGSAVLLRGTTAPDFFAKLRDGELTASDFNQV